jgi:hypothetical protein
MSTYLTGWQVGFDPVSPAPFQLLFMDTYRVRIQFHASILFICAFINDSFSNSDYKASNAGIINE